MDNTEEKHTESNQNQTEEKTEKHPGGRPPKIDINNLNLDALSEAFSKGYTDKQVAECLGVTEQTLNNYKNDYPEFFESLKRGKAIANHKVEMALYLRAMGYSHPDVNISNYQGKTIITPIIKHYPPDPASMIFFLKNRLPELYRDKQEVETIRKNMNINVDLNQLKTEDLKYLSDMMKRISGAENKEES